MSRRILIMPTSYNVFGAETNMLTLIKALHASSHYQIHVLISGWNNGQFESELKKAGICNYSVFKLGWFYISKPLWTVDGLVHLPAAYMHFLRLYHTFKPDIIFTNTYRYLFQLFPFFTCPVVLRIQDQLSVDRQARWILLRIDRKIHYYCVVSDFIRMDLISLGINPDKVKLIHNGMEAAAKWQKTNCLKQDILRIGMVGQIIPLKGHHVLIQALEKLADKSHPFILEIWGTGDETYIRKIKSQIQDLKLEEYIIWKGYESDRNRIYQDMDLLVAPTTFPQEAFGLVVVEAMAYGIPVIASNGGGFPEIIDHGKNGFLFAPGDADELAQYIAIMLQQPDLRRKMGEAARKKVEQQFTKEKMLHAFFDLLNEM